MNGSHLRINEDKVYLILKKREAIFFSFRNHIKCKNTDLHKLRHQPNFLCKVNNSTNLPRNESPSRLKCCIQCA